MAPTSKQCNKTATKVLQNTEDGSFALVCAEHAMALEQHPFISVDCWDYDGIQQCAYEQTVNETEAQKVP
jgi:hypothetical protein